MRRRPSPFALIPLLLLAVTCLFAVLVGILLFLIPQQAKEAFGPPSPNLGLPQRVYLSFQLLMHEAALTQPADAAGEERPFRVQLGEPTGPLINRLASEGFIADTEALRLYLHYSGLDTSLQAGDYQLSPSMTPVEIARALQDPTPGEVIFHILPGWRVEEIAAALPTSGLEVTPDEFLSLAAARPEGYPFSTDLPSQAGAEGFLFPDSYQLARGTSVQDLFTAFFSNFSLKVDASLAEGFRNQGLDVYEAVTLASIVEREAVSDEEMPLIVSVFLNRLETGMKLDSDPTVQYALGYDASQETWWKNPLGLEDLQVDSPYNTYVYAGLPPGPIANPGHAALQAVAFPAQTPYYFFRSTCDGSGKHTFAETFEEHLQNECR